jgi:hypothetical protein
MQSLSSPGITLGLAFITHLTKKLQVGQLVGWSVLFHGYYWGMSFRV